MINLKNFTPSLAPILYGIFLVILLFRSGTFLLRFIAETQTYITNRKADQTFMPDVTPCSSTHTLATTEEKYLFNYRSLGVTCKK